MLLPWTFCLIFGDRILYYNPPILYNDPLIILIPIQYYSIVLFQSYLRFWGIVFILTTTFVAIFVTEKAVDDSEQDEGLVNKLVNYLVNYYFEILAPQY